MQSKLYTLPQLAQHLGIEQNGLDNTKISGVASLENATADKISFYAHAKQHKFLATTHAAAVILKAQDQAACSRPTLVCDNPYLAFARLTQLYSPQPTAVSGVHPSAVIARDARLGKEVAVGANTVIGAACDIGDRVVIGANCTLAEHCCIGADSRLMPQVVLLERTQLGQRVLIHSGVVIGSDGFGFVPDGTDWVKIKQLGYVKIGDDVEIGANSAIDRATLDSTLIGNGVKIDNLVHISHNTVIGERTAIAACVGIAGSTTIGADCKIGGAAMINGQIEICSGTTITAGTRVYQSIRKKGRYTSGLAPLEHREWLKSTVYFKQLYKLLAKLAKQGG